MKILFEVVKVPLELSISVQVFQKKHLHESTFADRKLIFSQSFFQSELLVEMYNCYLTEKVC